MLHTPREVIRCLVTYTDWWQPATTSILQVGASRRDNAASDGFRAGVLDTLDERAELARRTQQLEDRERRLLFLWYVRELPVRDIARAVGVSRRHCFRLRAETIRNIIRLGDPQEVAG